VASLNSQVDVIKIGVKLPISFSSRNAVIQGLVNYVADQQLNWEFEIEQPAKGEVDEVLIDKSWVGEGLIVFREEENCATSMPSVGLSVESLNKDRPRVIVDNVGAGRLAAQHLFSIGMRQFLYIGRSNRECSRLRYQGFSQVLEQRSTQSDIVELPSGLSREECKRYLDKVVLSLDSGVGIFVMDDILAEAVLMSCRRVSRRVPEDFAVIGFIGESLTAQTMRPALSGVVYPGLEVGYAAGRNLHLTMMGKKNMVESTKLIRVTSIEARESTNHVASVDPRIVRVIRWIREEAGSRAISVSEICQRSGVGSSTLKFHFAKTLGHSPKAEISKVRVEVMKQRLEETNHSVGRIAQSMGFIAAEEASRFFKKMTGLTPSQYRSESRK